MPKIANRKIYFFRANLPAEGLARTVTSTLKVLVVLPTRASPVLQVFFLSNAAHSRLDVLPW